ncbi:hypothetical protein BZG36_04979 [Bifiguratus adelaidae]|uniref:Uncharacterized protein n=1 Tax=Bifiguratus adelaidae TaxID=1938954 RepID=A0A261XV35_9FUNG|nr:hypothetical protein BZG36_04979 [Bifiguratus adelaidae]
MYALDTDLSDLSTDTSYVNTQAAKAKANLLLPECVVMKKRKLDGTPQPPQSMAIRLKDERLYEWIVSPNGQGPSIWANLHKLEELSQFISQGWQVYTKPDITQPHDPSILKAPSKSTGTVLRARQD